MHPTPRPHFLLGTVLASLLLWVGCNSNVPVKSYTYVCASNADCIQGFTCIANVCSNGTAAGPDTSAGDTGTADTATSQDAEVSPKCSATDVNCLTNCGMNKCPLLLYKCNEDKDCKAAITCYAACANAPCRAKCLTNATPASQAAMSALQDCLAKKCM